MNRLKEKYLNKVRSQLKKEFELENVMQVPAIKKVVVNSGIGSFRDNREAVENFTEDLSNITGQRVYARKARKSEAGFKVRKNDVVGYAVTLRDDNMWAFLDKFVNIALPRVRDFRGLNPNAFDEHGNYSVGVKEHVIFPEVNPNTVKGIRSIQITVVMDSKEKEMNLALLRELGFPFRKDN